MIDLLCVMDAVTIIRAGKMERGEQNPRFSSLSFGIQLNSMQFSLSVICIHYIQFKVLSRKLNLA